MSPEPRKLHSYAALPFWANTNVCTMSSKGHTHITRYDCSHEQIQAAIKGACLSQSKPLLGVEMGNTISNLSKRSIAKRIAPPLGIKIGHKL